MILVGRSSVNRWECDENDHLNVRFYVRRHMEILRAGLRELGLWDGQVDLQSRVTTQHLRFLKESRLAMPVSGYFAICASSATDELQILTELQHSHSRTVLCSCVHHLKLTTTQALPDEAVVDEPPAHAQPRGLSVAGPAYLRIAREDLGTFGFRQIGAGLIGEEEVNAVKQLELAGYMGRVSDSMPHLWALLDEDAGDEGHSTAVEGGAVLEYRLHYHRPLNLWDQFGVYSGLAQAGAKVQTFAHMMYNETTRELAMSAQACGVRMDLETRKAVTLSAARQQHLRSLAITVPAQADSANKP